MTTTKLLDKHTTYVADVPVLLDAKRMRRRLRGTKKGTAADPTMEKAIDEARQLAAPQGLYRLAYVDSREEGGVQIAGVTFTSKVLRSNLDAVERVFFYIITVGAKLEEAASAADDILQQYYLEQLADVALEDTLAYMREKLQADYAVKRLSRMNPGSLSDWPLTEQKKLFSLFDPATDRLGVHLTSSYLMLPRKSVSGLFFPSEASFVSCRLCPRKNCPRRRVAYDAAETKRYNIKTS